MIGRIRISAIAVALMVVAGITFPGGSYAASRTGWYVMGPGGSDSNNCYSAGVTVNASAPRCKTLTHICQLQGGNPLTWLSIDPGTYVENALCVATGAPDDTNGSHYINIIAPSAGATFSGVPGVQKPVLEFTGSYIHMGKFYCQNNTSTTQDCWSIHGTDATHLAVGDQVFYNTTISGNAGIGMHANYTSGFVFTRDVVLNMVLGGILIENSPAWVVYGNGISRIGSLSGIPVTPGYGVKAVNSPGGCYQENMTKNEKNGMGQYGVVPNLALVNSPGAYVLGNFAPFAYTADAPSQVGLVVSPITDQGPCATMFQ